MGGHVVSSDNQAQMMINLAIIYFGLRTHFCRSLGLD